LDDALAIAAASIKLAIEERRGGSELMSNLNMIFNDAINDCRDGRSRFLGYFGENSEKASNQVVADIVVILLRHTGAKWNGSWQASFNGLEALKDRAADK